MSYEPRGKVKAALDAMRADPERIWSAPELAAVMGIAAAAVPAYLDAMIKHDMVFRRVEGGRSQYALRAFGLQELEGGGHRLPAEALARLRRFVAWMPA